MMYLSLALAVCGNSVCEYGEPGACSSDCPSSSIPKQCTPRTCNGHGSCATATGTCQCFAGYAGPGCVQCGFPFLPSTPSTSDPMALATPTDTCVFLAGALGTCSDGVQNNGESGVDCGGPHCATVCAAGEETGLMVTNPGGGLATGSIAGIAIGCVVAVVIAVVAVLRLRAGSSKRHGAHGDGKGVKGNAVAPATEVSGDGRGEDGDRDTAASSSGHDDSVDSQSRMGRLSTVDKSGAVVTTVVVLQPPSRSSKVAVDGTEQRAGNDGNGVSDDSTPPDVNPCTAGDDVAPVHAEHHSSVVTTSHTSPTRKHSTAATVHDAPHSGARRSSQPVEDEAVQPPLPSAMCSVVANDVPGPLGRPTPLVAGRVVLPALHHHDDAHANDNGGSTGASGSTGVRSRADSANNDSRRVIAIQPSSRTVLATDDDGKDDVVDDSVDSPAIVAVTGSRRSVTVRRHSASRSSSSSQHCDDSQDGGTLGPSADASLSGTASQPQSGTSVAGVEQGSGVVVSSSLSSSQDAAAVDASEPTSQAGSGVGTSAQGVDSPSAGENGKDDAVRAAFAVLE